MPKNAATKSSFKMPARHFDKNGKITNWSMHWPEAKELEVLVVGGVLDGMKPAEVMKQYSDRFGNKFGYKPFASGLMNIRKKHNKEIFERNKHADNDGEYHGLKAKASELNDLEDEDVLDVSDEGFEDLADEVSRMGIGSDDDDDAETMGFKSVRFTGDTKSFVGGGIARKKREYHLQPVLPYVLDKWTDEHLRSRVSIQIHGISGHEFKQCTEQRVSTDQQYFCHSWPLSKWHLTPERAFNAHILNRKEIKNDKSGVTMRMYKKILAHCSKTIARRKVISKLKGRDASKEKVMQEMRIPLPFKVQHRYVTKEEDPIFYGKQWIKYPHGEYHCHVELIGLQKDSYSPMKDCASVRSAKSAFVGMEGEIPTDISFENKGGDDDDDMDDSTWKTMKSNVEDSDDDDNGIGSVTPSEIKSINSEKCNKSTKSKVSMKSSNTNPSKKRQKMDEN